MVPYLSCLLCWELREAEICKLWVGREDRGDRDHQTNIELTLGSYGVVFMVLNLILFLPQ